MAEEKKSADSAKPQSVPEFVAWAREKLGADFDSKAENLYKGNSAIAWVAAQEHPFFRDISSFLVAADLAEQGRAGSLMLMNQNPPQLELKQWSAVLDKCYRLNIVWNREFPDPPKRGWVTPETVYGKITDLVRGTVICKHFDGPQLLAEQLQKRANDAGLEAFYYPQERDEGYYAYHFYVKLPMQLLRMDMSHAEQIVHVELQLTTQLQELLRQITHQFYVEKRAQVTPLRDHWKWDSKSDRFKAGYVSHTLHLLEAIIVQLRDDAHKRKQEGS